MNINQFLKSGLNDKLSTAVSKKLDISGDKSKAVIDLAIPLLINGLAKNSKDTKEASNISEALLEDHDGSILNNILSSLQNDDTETEGMKILEHILGKKQAVASKTISNEVNVDSNQVLQILALVAPYVMGALGRQQKETDLDTSKLSSLLQNLSKQDDKDVAGLIS